MHRLQAVCNLPEKPVSGGRGEVQPGAFTFVPGVVNYFQLIWTFLADFEVAGVNLVETIALEGHCVVDAIDVEVEEQVVEEIVQ